MASIQTEAEPPLGGDPMVTYGLSQFAPTPLHLAALSGKNGDVNFLLGKNIDMYYSKVIKIA